MYVHHFEIYGPKKLYENGLFKRNTPFFKKENPLLVKNYRPPSVQPTVSRISERIMQKQIIDYIKQMFSFVMWMQKKFHTQTALLYLFEKWNFMLDKTEYVDAVLMDLSKVFDTINY